MSSEAVPTEAEVAERAELWRQDRSQASLNWLYWNYINSLQADVTPIDQVLALLGPPDDRTGFSYSYASKSGPSGQAVLYLEQDEQGHLVSWGIS